MKTCKECEKHTNCKIEEWYLKQHCKREDFACNGFTLSGTILITKDDYLKAKDIVDKFEEQEKESEPISPCPECGQPLILKWSGIKCSKCNYWDCY